MQKWFKSKLITLKMKEKLQKGKLNMKLGSTETGTGIVCENKTELALALSAIGDILDRDFWAKIEEECIQMSIGREPVYVTHLFDEVKEGMNSGCRVEVLDKSSERTHLSQRYIVYPFDVDPRQVINHIISTTGEISKKKPYKTA